MTKIKKLIEKYFIEKNFFPTTQSKNFVANKF